MVSVRLRERSSGAVLSVSTYHMPCIYWMPPVMTIHASLAAQHAHVRASSGV
jgi:hypothetical protein